MSIKIETSASAFWGRGLPNFYLLWMHVDGGRRESDFWAFCVDVINVCSLTKDYGGYGTNGKIFRDGLLW